ncbi:aminotransferase class V-fold PLP-dependent enzyme [Ornithinibacillus sp. 4-3]|uniref:Aminotransferase class V-fold PLP-dependent enzyme n=1 Tax=Ornithinibacillus sp. 4-3 TaxID=3231488 RepID=A0AB39HRP5_9BACI
MTKIFLNYRNQFPILNQSIQLSSCSQSAMNKNVKAHINKYIESWENNGMDWEGWMDAVENSRKNFAQLINADVDEIAVVSSVSHAISAIANSLNPSKARNQILLTENDFPCVGHVWLSQSNEAYDVIFASEENGKVSSKMYEKLINQKTLLTSISHVTYYSGYKQNLKEIAEIAHKKGSYLFVDAYQSAGQASIDVKESNIDFLAAGMQKYLLGIPGIAFLYIKKEIAKNLTPEVTGWFGQSDPFAFDIQNIKYASGARRFDSGTAPMINAFAAEAALNILLEIGVSNIEKYLQELSAFTIEYAKEKNLIVKTPLLPEKRGAMTAIYVPDASEIEKRMKEKNVIVSARNDVIRVAPHFYNHKEDIKHAIDLLIELSR